MSRALRAFPEMPKAALLEELSHDEDQLPARSKKRSDIICRPQFLGFAGPRHQLFPTETIVVLTFDDILVISDAIDHRVSTLETRLDETETGSPRSLFLRHNIARLAAAREKLGHYAPKRA